MASGEYGILNEEKDPLGQKRKAESGSGDPGDERDGRKKAYGSRASTKGFFLPQKGTKVVPGFGRDRLRAYRRDGVPVVTSENFAHFCGHQ